MSDVPPDIQPPPISGGGGSGISLKSPYVIAGIGALAVLLVIYLKNRSANAAATNSTATDSGTVVDTGGGYSPTDSSGYGGAYGADSAAINALTAANGDLAAATSGSTSPSSAATVGNSGSNNTTTSTTASSPSGTNAGSAVTPGSVSIPGSVAAPTVSGPTLPVAAPTSGSVAAAMGFTPITSFSTAQALNAKGGAVYYNATPNSGKFTPVLWVPGQSKSGLTLYE